MISTWLHGVTSIELAPIETLENKVSETTFYTRDIIVTCADGQIFSIALFSDDGHKLLVNDKDLASMTEIKKAA